MYDQHYGVALARRMYQNRPPTILDVPRNMALANRYWAEEVNGSNAFWQRSKRMVFRVPHYKSGAELDGAPRVEMEAPRGGELEGIHGHPTYVYPTNAYPTHAHQMPQELDAQPRSYPTR